MHELLLKGRCRDGIIINDFLFQFRHLLASFLFHDVASLLTLFFRSFHPSTCMTLVLAFSGIIVKINIIMDM